MPSLFTRSRTEVFHTTLQTSLAAFLDRDAMVVPVKMDKNVEKIRACTLGGVKGSAPDAVQRSSFSTRAFQTRSSANLQVRQIQNGVRTFISPLIILLSLIVATPLSRSTQCDLARFWRSSTLCSRLHCRMSLVCPHRELCFAPNSQPWIPLLITTITGHRW